MLVSSLMGTLTPAFCKHSCPFGGGSGDVVLQETLLRSCRWDVAVHGSGNVHFQLLDSLGNILHLSATLCLTEHCISRESGLSRGLYPPASRQ